MAFDNNNNDKIFPNVIIFPHHLSFFNLYIDSKCEVKTELYLLLNCAFPVPWEQHSSHICLWIIYLSVDMVIQGSCLLPRLSWTRIDVSKIHVATQTTRHHFEGFSVVIVT